MGTGWTFPPIGVEFSLESFPFGGIGHIYGGPCTSGAKLSASDFSGFAHIGKIKCKGLSGGELVAICFAREPIQKTTDLMTIRAFGSWTGMIGGSVAGLSAEGCVYACTAA